MRAASVMASMVSCGIIQSLKDKQEAGLSEERITFVCELQI
jgi:hypothetical protein